MSSGDIDKSDLKKRFCYIELEVGSELERKDFKENHYILFFLSGKVEVIYFGSRPQLIEGGNMVFLGRLVDCVIKALEPVRMIVLTFVEFGQCLAIRLLFKIWFLFLLC